MGSIDEPTFLVLNALFLRKMADRDGLAGCSGSPPAEVERVLARAESAGFVVGLGSQYLLTDDGRDAVLRYYGRTYRDLRDDPSVADWYGRFEVVNDRFLRLVGAWQTAGPLGGGQSGLRVLDRICRTVEHQMAAVAELAVRLPRYRRYEERFRLALDQVDDGRLEYVTSPTVDSLHGIWFEFHEDVLALLGRPREPVG